MTNVKTTVKGDKLIMEVDLTESHGPSKSGKTDSLKINISRLSIAQQEKDASPGVRRRPTRSRST